MASFGVRSPVKIQNFFDFHATTLGGEKINFSSYKGKVILVMNVASLWDTTVRDYTQMNELVDKFGDKLVILGFPCNQFGHQENTKNHEILNALKHVRPGNGFVPKFPIFEKLEVNGKNASEIFVFLRNHLPIPSDDAFSFMTSCKSIIWEPVSRTDLAWNFEKFLITPEGKPHKRFSRYFQTCNLQSEIKSLIERFSDTKL